MIWQLFFNKPNPFVPDKDGNLVPNGGAWIPCSEFTGSAEEVAVELAQLRISKRGAAVRATSGEAEIELRRASASAQFGLAIADLEGRSADFLARREAFVREWMAARGLGDDPARLTTIQLTDLLSDEGLPIV